MTKKKNELVVSLEELLEAGCHFGHQARRWNPRMQPYIYAVRDGVHVFDLVKTEKGLREAMELVKDSASKGKTLVMVGTKRQAQAIVREEAQKAGIFHVTERWLGGTITNWGQIKKSIDRLVEMKEKREKGEYEKYTKKENVLINREIAKLGRFLGGLVGLKRIPDAVFVVDTHREGVVIREAKMKGVEVIGMVDSNADPDMIDYVIPVNDDAVRSIKLVVSKIAEAWMEGKALKGKTTSKRNKRSKKGKKK
jgi:small subunit ribosomal protein S2